MLMKVKHCIDKFRKKVVTRSMGLRSILYKVLVCVAVVYCTTIQTTTSILCCIVRKCETHPLLKINNFCEIVSNWLEEAGSRHIQALLLGIYGTTCIFCMIIIELDVRTVLYVHH